MRIIDLANELGCQPYELLAFMEWDDLGFDDLTEITEVVANEVRNLWRNE